MPARTLRAVEIAMRIAAPLPSPALGGLRITLRPGGPWRGSAYDHQLDAAVLAAAVVRRVGVDRGEGADADRGEALGRDVEVGLQGLGDRLRPALGPVNVELERAGVVGAPDDRDLERG